MHVLHEPIFGYRAKLGYFLVLYRSMWVLQKKKLQTLVYQAQKIGLLYNGYYAEFGRSMSNGMWLKQTGSVGVPPFGLGAWENG